MTQVVSGIAYAGRSGSIDPSPTRGAGEVPRPDWLHELAERVSSTPPEWFSRFLPPDEGARESAVLILFGPPPEGATDEGEHVVLIERSHTMRTQPAQIAFPGGARDLEDDDLVATALREAQEEVGVDPAGVDVLAVPVAHLVDPGHRFSVTHPSGYVGAAFELGDLLLWGFTAGLLSSLLELGGRSQPWDPALERPLPQRYLGGGR